MMAIIGGTLTTESVPGASTRVVLTLPARASAPAGSDPAGVTERK